jgi:hypothetical protein
LEDGELEIGQVSSLIKQIMPAADIVDELMRDCRMTISRLNILNGEK